MASSFNIERARSISPQKSSPANTPSPTAHRIGLPPAADSTNLPSPSLEGTGSPRPRAAPSSDAMETATDCSGSPTKENESPFDSDTKRASLTMTSPSIGMPSARSTLSWQRRPTSQSSERPRSRTLTMVAAENAARSNSPIPADPAPAAEQTLSRDQIAQSLAGKDPSWFRQTADPGRGSATFRKSQVEDQDTVDVSSIRTQLPGMSRDSSIEPSKESSSRPQTPTAVPTKLGSPLPLAGSQRLDPPASDNTGDADTPTASRQSMVSTGGRTSPTRPVSPTKGMGGFVQSAMMKRSDSVKRWSINSPGGLQRAESTQGSQRGSPPKAGSRPTSMLRGSSDVPVLRPSSSQGDEKEAEPEAKPAAAEATAPSEAKTKDEDENTTPPSSPSKTMDPRRWSPNKNSSWLEAALNKPESPKAKPAPSAVNQPAWMVELNKAKAQKASTELARSASLPTKKPEVKTGGLLRSTPMGANLKPSALTGFPVVPPVTTTDKPAIGGFRNNLRKASPTTESPESESHEVPTGAAETKPEAPLKKDFRANLKPRVPAPETKSTEPVDELKNVFGTLRRAKTQNYVAPDELKDNILRGKAALNATGGPKKTERKDEFKEAILKKKEDFKKVQQEGRGITREPSSASEKTIPEGIAKKLEIQRTGTLPKQSPTTPDFPLQTPTLTGSNRSSFVSTASKRELSDVGSQSGPEHSREIHNDPVAKPAPPVTLPKQPDAVGRVQTKVGGLAERFNPALAGLIAKGPPPASGPSKSPGASGAAGFSTAETGEPAGPGPQLTHLTKNRARGPRRKAPTSVAKPAEEEKVVEAVSAPEKKPIALPKPEKFVTSPKPDELVNLSREEKPIIAAKPESFSTPKTETPFLDARKSVVEDKPKALGDVISLIDSSKRMSREEPVSVGQPISLVGSPPVKTRPRSPTKVHEQVAALAALSQQSPKPAEQGGEASQPSSPKKLDMKRMSRFMDEQSQLSPKPEPVKSRPTSPAKDRFPALASPSPAKQPANDPVELKPALPVKSGLFGGVGLGLSQPAPSRHPVADAEKPPQVPPKAARPLPPPPPMASPPPVTSPRIPSPVRSPGKQSSDVSALLNDFFGPERPKRRYTADAAEILMRRPASTPTVQTQRAQLFQLSAEGKKIPVPTHHERVLFEREMYVCPHTFTDRAGKKVNEVYFWAGDEVPESVVDDAHLFAAREARAFGGRLVKLSQGKETSEFLQALGGIVIVRRGSSNKYDSLAPNMLCGRRYLGQVAFDEVDFSPLSLCSGFPYLISQQGKCYLWKGKGSDVEELGCARLVGMDLALMGELLEVEEGNEPESFWRDVFGGGSRPSSADHWRLKPNYDKYSGRLFCADAGEKHQVSFPSLP